jgi:hypothetical protein
LFFIIGVNGGEDSVGVEGSEFEVESRSGVKGARYLINGVTGGEEKVGDSMFISSLKIICEFDLRGVIEGERRVGVTGSPNSSMITFPLASNFIISRVSEFKGELRVGVAGRGRRVGLEHLRCGEYIACKVGAKQKIKFENVLRNTKIAMREFQNLHRVTYSNFSQFLRRSLQLVTTAAIDV